MSVNVPVRTIEEKTFMHPCYNCIAHKYARMHIPVAPKCNVSCNFCNRKYDCVNETRPGVTSEVLTPEEAKDKFKIVKDKVRNLTVVGIAGPGDPLANFDETRKSIELIKNESKDIIFCLSTNGLMLPFYADKLIELGVTHLTVTINAVDPKIDAKIYKFVNYLGDVLVGEEAGRVLLNNQLSGLKYAAQKGIVCKVNIVMIKGVNDTHIPEVVKKVKECGAYMANIMPLIPVKGSVFENNPTVTEVELNDMRKRCESTLKQMYHCRQCRADAIGTLDNDISSEFRNNNTEKETPNDSQNKNVIELKGHKYRFAVASKSGISIDEHFGHASEFYIYDLINDEIKFREKRKVNRYCNGVDDCGEHEDKIENTIKSVIDCDAVLVVRAGFDPMDRLYQKGIRVFEMYQEIDKGIRKAVKLLKKDK